MTRTQEKEESKLTSKLQTVSSLASGVTVGVAVTASLLQAPLVMGIAAGGAVIAASTGLIAKRKRSREEMKLTTDDMCSSPGPSSTVSRSDR